MAYIEYKDSGQNWLKAIPSSWNVKRLKSLFSFGKGLPITKADLVSEGIPVISYGQVHAKYNSGIGLSEQLYRYVPEKNIKTNQQSMVHQFDFIVADTSEDKTGCGNCVYVDAELPLFAGYHSIILRSREHQDNKYLAYLFLTDAWRSQIRSRVDGVKLFSISKTILNNVNVIIPPRSEQDQIVRYLDWQVARINKLIHGYQKQIKLLEEELSTISSRAAIRGIREDVEYNNPHIIGFDKIPSQWKVLQNKRIFRERSDFSEKGDEILLSVSKHYGVKPMHELTEDEQYATIKPAETLVGYKKVSKGDLVMNIMRARNGSYGISDYDGIVSPAYCVYKTIIPVDSRYMQYLLKTPQTISIFEAYSYGIAEHRRRLYAPDFLRLYLPVPPYNEQVKIADFLDKKSEQIDFLTTKIKVQINLLREYRTRLISDVVTGQMDVRGIEIPDYTPEQDIEESGTEEGAVTNDAQ